MKLIRQIILFAFAGVIGFAFDAGVLYLVKGELGLYWGRAVSFLSAVLSTWIINRSLTFRQHKSGMRLWHEFLSYLGLMLGGGVVNYLTYAFLVSSISLVTEQPVWGVAAGSLAGMVVNFTLAKALVFRHRRRRLA